MAKSKPSSVKVASPDNIFPRVIGTEQLSALYNIPPSTAYAMASRGEFPEILKLTPKRSGWLTEELDAWLSERAAMRNRQE